jgi:hypothetical protein
MTQQIINLGTADKGNGDVLRTAFGKVNANFAELYNQIATSVVVGATAPTGPEEGALWWNSESGRMYVYFGTAWVDSSPVDGAGISSTNQLVNGAYTVSLGTNGVLTLADGSIINGATLKTIAGNYAGITAGPASPAGKDEDSWMWVDNNGATIATKYSTDAHTWTFNNSGALTFPQGTTIATADGTDAFIIDGAVDKDIQIYTYSGPTPTAHGWTFGADGSLTLPGTGWIKDSIGRGFINVNTMGNNESIVSLGSNSVDEMVTSTIEIAPNYGIGLTSVRNVDITAGYDIATVKWDLWQAAEAAWVTARNEDALEVAPDTRPWEGMPSYEAYPVMLTWIGEGNGSPLILPLALDAKTAYDTWQTEQSAINVTITARDKTWTFNNDGNLTTPVGLRFGGSDGHAEITNTSPNASLYIVNTGLNQLVVEWTAGNNQLPVGADVKAAGIYAGVNGLNIGLLNAQDVSHSWHFNGDGSLRFPDLTEQTTAWTGITGFGEGFSLTAADKIVTNKLYSTNLTQPTQHYRLELDTNGVVVLPDGSIINGSTIRGVAGTGELNYTGITIGPNINDAEKTWMWVDHENAYVSTNNAAHTWTFGNDGKLTLPLGAGISETASSPGLLKRKYSGTFVLDPTWFAANAGNLVETTTINSTIQSTDLEVFNAFSFEFTGYFVPPTSNLYTFKAHADETFIFWIGDKALSGYTYANKDMYGDYNGTSPEQQVQSFTIALTAGQFYPIRIQWGNSAGWGQLDTFTWARFGQADSADFSGLIYTANTGAAIVSVSDNKSIVLRTDNDITNNWNFAPDGSLTFPDNTVQSTAYVAPTTGNSTIVSDPEGTTVSRNGMTIRVTSAGMIQMSFDSAINVKGRSSINNTDSTVIASPNGVTTIGTWYNIGAVLAEGDHLTATIVDESYHHIYRLTAIIIQKTTTPGQEIVVSYAIIEQLQ